MNNLVRFDPFEEIRALQRQFFNDDWFGKPMRAMSSVTTDVYTDDDKQLTVESHLPNFDEKDINLQVENGNLVIQAEKHEKEEDKKKKYVVRESSSSFYRRIRLPENVDESKLSASFENGVLKVVAPFKQLPQPKKIAIAAKNAKATENK